MSGQTSHHLKKNNIQGSTFIKKLQAFVGSPLARWLVLGLFVAQASVLAVVTQIGVPPDESNHIKFIEYYADHSLSPFLTKQTPTVNLGDKTREVDYLYHYTASFLYRVSPLSTHDTYIGLRLITVALALLTMLVLAHLFRRVGVSGGVITMALLVITNLPMVLMMSSAINNDVFVWLGTVLGLLLLVRLWQKPTTLDFLWLIALCLLGGLVKRDLLVIGLFLGILGIVVLIRRFKPIMQGFKRFNWKIALAIFVVLIGLGLFTERVGGNLIAYHTPTPSCEQVQGVQPCEVFWGTIREHSLAPHKHDPLLPIPVFVGAWFGDSIYNVVDIQTQGWRHEVKPSVGLVSGLGIIFLVGVVLECISEYRQRTTDKNARLRLMILGVAILYIGALLVVNYKTYLGDHVYGIALNGRYLLPSILLLVPLASLYWTTLLRKRPWLLTILVVCVVVGVIFGSGLIMMLRNPQLIHG